MDHLKATGSSAAEKVTPASENADLVARLRASDWGWSGDADCVAGDVAAEGADEIERLRKLIHRYRAAMEAVCDELEEDFDTVDGGDSQPAPNKAMRLASDLKEAIYGPGGY